MNDLDARKQAFIERARLLHGLRYDYSNINYVNSSTKVQIQCSTHGIFLQRPSLHTNGNGQGCPKCARQQHSKKVSKPHLTSNQFIERAHQVHQFKYCYDMCEFVSSTIPIVIVCPTHGQFTQTPRLHMLGHGCQLCGADRIRKRNSSTKYTTHTFIKAANIAHSGMYDYSNVKYVDAHTKVSITCRARHVFTQTPGNHLSGIGCPRCNRSKGELAISKWLDCASIQYEQQKTYDQLIGLGGRALKYDFYIPSVNTLIEYDGQHHFDIVTHGETDQTISVQRLERTVAHDAIKTQYAIDNNINLVRIHYTNYSNVGVILNQLIQR